MDKIPASIGILTLNSGRTLRACLESVKDFAEIIICDGNSTDDTLMIAREYGAKIIKQYESDEPNLGCATDKANVRQKNMEAASYDWYFFMDSDDTLAPAVMAEIRAIIANPNPEFLVYKMPTRIFIGEHEIKYWSFAPGYQIRFLNRKINPHFRGPVHDRIVFDKKKYPAGLLRNCYEYRWPGERVKNYWQFLKKYVARELITAGRPPLRTFFLTDIWWSLKTALGHLLWRIPRIYIKYGFRDSMPWTVEFNLLVRYNFSLVYHLLKKRVSETAPVTFIAEIWRKKDVERILVNIALRKKEIYGKILDIGSGGRASHYRFIKIIKWSRIYTADISPAANPHYVLNIEYDRIPSQDDACNFILAFNLLEHLGARKNFLDEVRRVLLPGGKILGSVPFLMDVHPDPHDYFRFSKEQLQIIFTEAGLKNVKIDAIGRGPFLAGYYQIDFLIPRIVKFLVLPVVFLLDAMLQKIKPQTDFREKYPLAYVFEATK